MDESDVWSTYTCIFNIFKFHISYQLTVDNRSKRRRDKSQLFQDLSSYAVHHRDHNQTITPKISPQLALATFQILSSTIPAFNTSCISENVLQRLMRQGSVIRFIRVKEGKHSDSESLIYQKVRCFIIINRRINE